MMVVSRAFLAVTMCIWAFPLLARTLEVGEDKQYKAPSEAVAAAKDGDTIDIYPGQYFDCAAIVRNDVTIEGKGVIPTDKTCGGKALLITAGNNIIVRNITLQRARSR